MAVKVLHVAEAFGGGVATAVAGYASRSPQVESWLLYATREDAPTDSTVFDSFAKVEMLPSGHMARIRRIRELGSGFDIVHAHSSFGGLYSRLAFGRRSKPFVIYTPHGFSFERSDIGPIQKSVFRLAETVLAQRTGIIAGASPREVSLGSSLLGMGKRTVMLPSSADGPIDSLQETPSTRKRARLHVVTVGRNTAAKDPGFFVEMARHVHALDPKCKITWIGGDTQLRDSAPEYVEVTGWLPRADVMNRLQNADVYVHTALWEAGPPISLIEAVDAGLAPVVRQVPAISGVDLPVIVDTPLEMAESVLNLRDVDERRRTLGAAKKSLSSFGPEPQQRALAAIYRVAVASRKKPIADVSVPQNDPKVVQL